MPFSLKLMLPMTSHTDTLELVNEKSNAHSYDINLVAFSPDGKTLVSASNDRAIKVWSLGECGASPAPKQTPAPPASPTPSAHQPAANTSTLPSSMAPMVASVVVTTAVQVPIDMNGDGDINHIAIDTTGDGIADQIMPLYHPT